MISGRNQGAIDAALRDLGRAGPGKAVGQAGDVSDAGDISHLFEATMAQLGGVDILFNNAGTGSEERIIDAPDERWQYYWDMHVMAVVRLSRLCVPSMEKRGGGVIINNASVCAIQPIDYEPIYNVSKAALLMLGKCMANEFIARGIRVNTLSPGLIMTPNWEKFARRQTQGGPQSWEKYLEEIGRRNAPAGRFGSAMELADFVVFLASARASYCVGANYYVDGGYIRTIA